MLSRPELLLRAMSVALQQPGSVLMFVAHVATKGHTEALGLGHNLWPSWCLRTVPSLQPCWFKWLVLPPWALVLSRPELLLSAKGHLNGTQVPAVAGLMQI